MDRPYSRLSIALPIAAVWIVLAGVPGNSLAEGLPGEYLINDRWRAMLVEHSALSNPALLVRENYVTARLAASKPLMEFSLVEGGLAWPLGLYQTVGATWTGLFTSKYAATGLRLPNGALGDPFAETGEQVRDAQNFLTLSYAANFWRGLSGGINVNFAHQNLYNQESRIGFGVDVGLLYRLITHPSFGTHEVGLGVQNLLAPALGDNEKFARNLTVTWLGKYLEGRVGSVVEYRLSDLLADESDFLDAKALEWSVLGRLDLWLLRMFKLYGIASIGNGTFQAGGFGVGLNVPGVNGGRDLEFMYQFLAVNQGLSGSHSVSLRTEFGKHREEIYARKMAARLNVAPNDLYTRALALYTQRKFWDAYVLFSELLRDYSDFFKNDWVSYFRGSCLEELDLRGAADTVYTAARRDFVKSTAAAYMDLGRMRIAYRNNDRAGVERHLRELNKATAPDTLKFHAYYLMAQMNARDANGRGAKALLEVIPPGHPEHLFARHTLAVLNLRENNYDAAIENLQAVVQSQPANAAQQEIVNRSYVLLGYLFYEQSREIEGGLAKAVTALRRVPASSVYRDDALLGLGWCALKARQWGDCMEAGRALVSESPRPVNRCEGYLLQAYTYTMQKDHSAALDVLTAASAVLDTLKAPGAQGLSAQTLEYGKTRGDYEQLGRSALELGMAPGSPQLVTDLTALHDRQKNLLAGIREYYKQKDAFDRNAFFCRSLGELTEDVQYAMARAKQLTAGRGVTKAQQKVIDKTQDIDEEIEKLQQELKDLKK